MNWKPFHHPDLSLPVVRRRASEEWIDILAGVGEILLTRGRCVEWNKTYPTSTAYRSAMARLQKKGLIIRTTGHENLPRLILTEAGKRTRADYHDPDRFWSKRWNGIWYMLIFDVPEKERHYRDTLRKFLKQLRMGCLQRSVWITPQDIRPEYDDLEKTASIHAVAYLLESRTVLNEDQEEMVRNAWDFQKLNELHRRYIDIFTENLHAIPHTPSEDALMELLYLESEAYIQSMACDPLLPRRLHPSDYLGPQVWDLHNQLRTAIAYAL
jgi:phenylacetic acid degradation operon negative regulatory protein